MTVSYKNNIKAGTATVTITDKAGGNYTVNGSKTFTITKAAPAYTTPTGLTATYGQTLAKVAFPTASNGKWSWANSKASVGNVGTNSFKATFTPKDTNNYNTVTVGVCALPV